MKIGIDISQTAFGRTGVSNYLSDLVCGMLEEDHENEYVLFFASLRGSINPEFKSRLAKLMSSNKKISIKSVPIPPTLLDLMWNKFHIVPIENLIGNVDFFMTSDWTEPPARKAKKGSILYDLIVYKFPQESHNQTKFLWKDLIVKPNIVESQKRKHKWMKKEDSVIFCISESTKKDAEEILKIPKDKLHVIYPGLTL